MTKLSSKLAKDDSNGLGPIVGDLLHEPSKVHVIIALIDCAKTTINHDLHEPEPTARIKRIEVVAAVDLKMAQRMLERAFEKRRGDQVLPFELEEDVRSAFTEVTDLDDL